MSSRLTSRFVAISSVAAAMGLVGHFVVAPPPSSYTSSTALEAAARHHEALVTDAWLDGIGSMLLIVTLIGVVELSGLASTLAGRLVLLGGAATVAHSLLSDSLVIASAQIWAAGDGALAIGMLQVAHAADYAYPVVNIFWASALGLVVLRSKVLPAVFGYVALAFSAVELVGGLAALYSEAVNSVINPFFLVMVVWGVAAGVVLAIRSTRTNAALGDAHFQAATAHATR